MRLTRTRNWARTFSRSVQSMVTVARTALMQLLRLGLAEAGEQFRHVAKQRRQLLLDRVSHQRVIDQVVAVNQDVAKGDDLPMIANTRRCFGVDLGEPPDRLGHCQG
jgi:hypothetical protein